MTSDTPRFDRLAYLVATETELALIRLKSGVVRVFLDEILERVPRADVASVELGGGVAPPLTIVFRDATSWELEVPRPSMRYAKALVDVVTKAT